MAVVILEQAEHKDLIDRVRSAEQKAERLTNAVANIATGLDNQVTSTEELLDNVKNNNLANASVLVMLKKYWYIVIAVIVLLGYLMFGNNSNTNKKNKR